MKKQQFQPGISMKKLQQLFDLNVIIRVRSGDWEATWPARFDRIRHPALSSVSPPTCCGDVPIYVKPNVNWRTQSRKRPSHCRSSATCRGNSR
jgi:hypothetical protein